MYAPFLRSAVIFAAAPPTYASFPPMGADERCEVSRGSGRRGAGQKVGARAEVANGPLNVHVGDVV